MKQKATWKPVGHSAKRWQEAARGKAGTGAGLTPRIIRSKSARGKAAGKAPFAKPQ